MTIVVDWLEIAGSRALSSGYQELPRVTRGYHRLPETGLVVTRAFVASAWVSVGIELFGIISPRGDRASSVPSSRAVRMVNFLGNSKARSERGGKRLSSVENVFPQRHAN